ncbi:MAG: tRNA pseudouridine(13) synthase TruD [Candidatus Bathyarchaeota archaeon]|nr:tRNA pseudouridine(13) synthase TruD [Candidatus Bathyarchaeota archaeon]
MKVPTIEKQLGIETFVTKTRGIGGVIRQMPEDFMVEEVLVDGSKAELKPKLRGQVTGEGRYLICLLVKRDWDTLLAARKIAKQLGISERRVRIAGIKDKKALTAQHISIENINLRQLRRIRVDDIHVYPLRYSPNMIFPHMSFGNTFHISVRNISHSNAVLQERMSDMVNELRVLGGIPNFFGHQRFGTIRPITHLVGKALARDDLERAALLFLAKSSPYEHPQSREARQRLQETRDFKEVINVFPRWLLYERLMLAHLVKHPKNFVGAFRRLPRRLCRLFLQAYQSYIFNRFLSQRLLRKIPINEPQLGDYVVKTDSHGLPIRSYIKATHEKLEDLRKKVKKGEMYVAIPLIGFKQTSSEGLQGEIEHSILESEKITQANFYVSSAPEMSAAGELRATMTPIINLNADKPVKDESNLRKKELRISFTLHRGCYATVVLREFMKPRNMIKAGF